jgi:hypothetical protein
LIEPLYKSLFGTGRCFIKGRFNEKWTLNDILIYYYIKGAMIIYIITSKVLWLWRKGNTPASDLLIIHQRWEETSRFAFLLFKITQCHLIQINCYQFFFLEKSACVDSAYPQLYTIVNQNPFYPVSKSVHKKRYGQTLAVIISPATLLARGFN